MYVGNQSLDESAWRVKFNMETETGMVDTNMDQNESAVKNATQIGEPMDVDPKPPQKDKDS